MRCLNISFNELKKHMVRDSSTNKILSRYIINLDHILRFNVVLTRGEVYLLGDDGIEKVHLV